MLPLTTRSVAAAALVVIIMLWAALPVNAAGQDPFAGGTMRMSVLMGNGYAFDQSYFVIGVGVGYFVAKGLEIGLDGESWSGGTPGITKISPALKYVVPTNGALKPYVGAFYRRTMIDNFDDLNSAGGRAGVYFISGKGSYIGLGGVYEVYLSCNETVYHSCTSSYPEIIFAIAF